MPRVAAVQFAPIFGDKTANLRRMALLVAEAAGKGAELIVFPELATTGYSLMGMNDAVRFGEFIVPDAFVYNVADTTPPVDPCPTMRVMRALALKYKVHLVWGMVENQVGTENYYNSQVYLGPDLKMESYRKVNLWGNDYLWAQEGRGNPPIINAMFSTGMKRLGLLICRDVRDKKDDNWKSFYEKGDADIVAFSANWGDGGFPAVAWMDFAKENNVSLVVSNRYGQETCNNFGEGGVCVVEPKGKVHCEGLKWNADCIVYAEIP
jgi:predicted amidohydrolase